MRKTDYSELCNELSALTVGVPHKIANLANAAALLFNTVEEINWAGFYLLEGDKLVLSAFQGKPACIEIQVGKGVCGSAVEQGKTLVVKNVHEFKGHIACDSASMSEIVIPLFVNGRIWGVLDIDSPYEGRFDGPDKDGLENFARILCHSIESAEK